MLSRTPMNVIPGQVKFSVDIRGIDIESIQRVVQRLNNSVEKAEKILVSLLTFNRFLLNRQ